MACFHVHAFCATADSADIQTKVKLQEVGSENRPTHQNKRCFFTWSQTEERSKIVEFCTVLHFIYTSRKSKMIIFERTHFYPIVWIFQIPVSQVENDKRKLK